MKTKSLKVVDDENARKQYWEQQFGTSYEIGEISEENKIKLQDLVKDLPIGRMLDNGCGDGRLKKYFEELGWEMYGSDISQNAIIKASKITPINLVCAISEDLPFKDMFFDSVLSWRVLHSLFKNNRIQALKEIDRVLKHGGHLFMSVQSADDVQTIQKYQKNGIEHPEDARSYVTDMEVAGTVVQRLKHFFTKDEIIQDIETNTSLQVTKIEIYSEKAGWSDQTQIYWNIIAVKE